MPVSLYDLSMIVIVHAAIQLTGLAFIIVVAVRGFRDMRRGHEELIRLSRTSGAFIFQEDEKIRALVNARFDEIMRQLPR
jgi:hypothetical protein